MGQNPKLLMVSKMPSIWGGIGNKVPETPASGEAKLVLAAMMDEGVVRGQETKVASYEELLSSARAVMATAGCRKVVMRKEQDERGYDTTRSRQDYIQPVNSRCITSRTKGGECKI